MKLQSQRKLSFDRCVEASQTITRLEGILGSRYDYWLHEEAINDELHWSAMFIEGTDFRSMGKGVTRDGSKAGALAEGAEWLLSRGTGDLPGYVGAFEHETADPVPIASLL